jgi:hypothetical protein
MSPILNLSTIHIQNELQYVHRRIESGGDLSRPATEPQGHGASLERGMRPQGKNPPERLPNQTFVGGGLCLRTIYFQYLAVRPLRKRELQFRRRTSALNITAALS